MPTLSAAWPWTSRSARSSTSPISLSPPSCRWTCSPIGRGRRGGCLRRDRERIFSSRPAGRIKGRGSPMPERRVVVGSKVGLHARPAALFVQAAAKQPVKVTIAKGNRPPVDARSILAVLSLDARGGEEVARLKGVGVSPGVAIGPVAVMGGEVPEPPATPPRPGAQDAELEAARGALEARGEAAGGDVRDVLEAQAMMVRDPSLADQVAALTAQGRSAARAVWESFTAYREILAGAGEYMAARVADLDDLRARTVA